VKVFWGVDEGVMPFPEPGFYSSSRAKRGDPSWKKRSHGLPRCARSDEAIVQGSGAVSDWIQKLAMTQT
jgi:hypothetical protein